MRPFSGHPARVRTPSPPGCGVGEIIPLLRALQVSTVLDTWYIYSTDIGEVVRAYSGQFPTIFDPSILGGQNRKNRNYARPRRAVASPFQPRILVDVCDTTTSFLCCRVNSSNLGRSRRVCDPLSFLHLVCLFSSLGILLTQFQHYLEPEESMCTLIPGQGGPPCILLVMRGRSAPRLLTSFPLRGSMLSVPQGLLYLRTPCILVRLN